MHSQFYGGTNKTVVKQLYKGSLNFKPLHVTKKLFLYKCINNSPQLYIICTYTVNTSSWYQQEELQ